MSTVPVIQGLPMPLIGARVRAYFAPVDRVAKSPVIFDPAISGMFNLDGPPSPWVDLGWIDEFTRSSQSELKQAASGVPNVARFQTRVHLGATVGFRFKHWSKLSMALAAGSQHMNVLAPTSASTVPIGSGAKAAPATALGSGCTATSLVLNTPGTISTGSVVVVDMDYAGQTGYVGTGVSAAYVQTATSVGNDPDYVRRVSFNVSRVASVSSNGTIQLLTPLPDGAPASGMKIQQVLGFVDREGGTFFQEWSALFVVEGTQGDRLLIHYPRLQGCQPAAESWEPMDTPLLSVLPKAEFLALPVIDANDGEEILCYRTYIPGPTSSV